jgi:hypothetical protein
MNLENPNPIRFCTSLEDLNQDYIWGEAQEQAFYKLKVMLTSAPILKQPIWKWPF